MTMCFLRPKSWPQRKTRPLGQVISSLARKALIGTASPAEPEYRNGFRLLPRTGKLITAEMVDNLLEED